MLENLKKLSQSLGLHPLVGFGMFAVDMMLFDSEVLTFGLSWPVSIAIGAALTLPSVLIQKHSFGDDWGAATGKGLLIGVLTAIPTPLPAIIPLLGGALGTMQILNSKKDEPKVIEAQVIEKEPTLIEAEKQD